MCSTLGLHKKVHSFFFGVVRLGDVWRGGGEMVHVSGGRGFAWGFRGGRGDLSSGLSTCHGTCILLLSRWSDCFYCSPHLYVALDKSVC